MSDIQYWKGAKFAPRDWQERALPLLIEAIKKRQRPIVSAIMGSGKSVLIAELVWVALHKTPKDACVVVTAPRQSLVAQLAKTIEDRVGIGKVGMFYTYKKEWDKRVVVCCNASAMTLAGALQANNKNVVMLVGDEVHGTESEKFKDSYINLKPACAIGFTATPFRSSEKESLSLWTDVAYRYTAADALRDGVIVPWQLCHWEDFDFDLTKVDQICYQLIRMRGEGPGIVNALDIADAEKFSKYLTAWGIESRAVHSKLPKHVQEQALRQLQYGEIKCVVYVSLLSEGVDLPWLRWMCLRRPVQAKVRFVQEVGRVLRAHEGKKHAVIMDPHDLFSLHGLVYPEAIGEILETADEDEEDNELAKLDLDEEQKQKIRTMPPAVAVTKIGTWLKSFKSLLRVANILKKQDDSYADGPWRQGKPSPKQIQVLDRMRWSARYVPQPHRDSIKAVTDQAVFMTKGDVGDLIDIYIALADASREQRAKKRHWHFPKEINLPVPEIPIQGLLIAATREKNDTT